MSSDIELVLKQIDREELANLALELSMIDSPSGEEKKVADFVEAWLRQEGFETRVVGLLPERPNVVGIYKGSGGGYSLLFNSHMDTSVSEEDSWQFYDTRKPADHGAWREGDKLIGNGIVNDKGPMACFLIAVKAIKKAGVSLKGDLLLTAVSGEIERAPIDEFQDTQYLSHEIGARSMVAHGVIADYALVAEATDFHLAWLEAGKAVFKVSLFASSPMYAPYLDRPYPLEKNPNAIVQMAKVIDAIEDWALEYRKKNTYTSPGGTLVPTVNIGAIRGGSPHNTCVTSELCSIYVDFRTAPDQDVLAIKAKLEDIIQKLQLKGKAELFAFRRGYEAQNIDCLVKAIEKAHYRLFKEKLKPVIGPECSMWRDINVFNEAGIPAATYGPGAGMGGGNYCLTIEGMCQTAQAYVMIALDICNQKKPT